MEKFRVDPFQKKFEKEKPPEKREKIEGSFEREDFRFIDRVVVKGSVPLALMSGKSLELARDVDVFLIERGYTQTMNVQNFDNLDQVKKKLKSDVFELVERFVAAHNLGHMPLQVVCISEHLLSKGSLFNNEPEVVLWDSSMELKDQLLKQITASEKEKFLQKLPWHRDPQIIEELRKNVQEAHNLHLYKEGKLYRGEVPNYLTPSSDRLAAALRLEDLGRRFGIPADDHFLRMMEEEAKGGAIMLAVPPAHRESEIFIEEHPGKGYGHEFRIDKSGSIDIAFCNVAKKEGIKELLAEKYPSLAAISQKIENAGGLREFIKKEYGEAYLEKERLFLDAPSFAGSELSLSEQRVILDALECGLPQEALGDAKEFINACLELNKISPIAGLEAERLINTVFDSQLETLLSSVNTSDREKAYRIMGFRLDQMWHSGESPADYSNLKEKMGKAILGERSGRLRKVLMENLAQLANNGDLTVTNEFVSLVKKESTRIKIEKTMKDSGELLSPEGMNALRAIFEFDHRDANKAVFELMAHPKIDRRVKKVCLRNLINNYGAISGALNVIVRDDLKKDSKVIPWEDYVGLWRVENIASSAVREQISHLADMAFSSIRYSKKSVSEVKNAIAPQLPWEFFFALYTLSDGDAEKIKTWERIIAGTKSNKLRESLLHSLAELPQELFNLVTEKVIQSPEVTREHTLLSDRLLKKIHFLTVVERKPKAGATQRESVRVLLEEAKAPSLLEIKFDEIIVESLSELTERGDLTSSKIHSLFQAWENPEPFLLYIAELAHRSQHEEYGRTLRLVGEMLVHVDPEKMTEWKQWRYDRANPIVAEQLKNLSDKQVEAYANDEFADLGEVLVGLLPSDKPDRIRQEIFHAIQHDWPTAGVLEAQAIARFFPNVQTAIERGGQFEAEQVLSKDMEEIGSKMRIINEWLDLQKDDKFSKGLAERLSTWQKKEAQKAQKLRELGYRGDESAEEINEIIAQMRKAGKSAEKISAVSTLQPNPLSPELRALLNRRGVPLNASSEDIKSFQESIRADIERMNVREDFVALRQELFSENEVRLADWHGVMKDLKMAQLFLKLGTLSPQLIAFNKISPEKKKASLQSSIDSLNDHFHGKSMVIETIKRIQNIIDEKSHRAGRDHLAVIFTDNPLAMFSIGKFPAGAESCQHYRNGDTVLGAYAADAYTKMMLLVDIDKLPLELQSELEKAEDSASRTEIFRENTESFLNASVARRITKIVREVSSDKPQVFLEPVYTSLNRESAARILNAFAITHLQPKLDMEIVRGGGSDRVFVSESRNLVQYEDGESGGPGGAGGGLGTQSGSYRMFAQKLTDADYLVKV